MIVLASGDSLRGSASVAAVVDYSFHGLNGSVIDLLAEGQLPVADGELYPAAAIVVVKSMVLVNTHTSAVTINLTILKSGSTARRLIPKDMSLGIGFSLYFDGSKFYVINTSGEVISSASAGAHAASHVTGGADVIASAVAAGNAGLMTGADKTKLDGIEAAADVTDATNVAAAGAAMAAAIITDNHLIRGDGGVRGIQEATPIVSDNGEMTNPSQPAFLARPTANQTDFAVGGDVTVVLGTEVFNQGNNFASNTFTAPVTGKYQLSVCVAIYQLDTAATFYQLKIKTSNRTYTNNLTVTAFAADFDYFPLVLSVLADMDASDTAYVTITQATGTQQSDLTTDSFLSGELVC